MPSRDSTKTLILDTAPLLTSPLASLLPIATRFVTTSDVIEEVRGKGQRERLEREWESVGVKLETGGGRSEAKEGEEWEGLRIREPSVDGVAKVTSFARQTGDIAVLSTADIRVLALAYDIEVEANGTWRLRDKVGGKRLGKDPEKKKARLARKAVAVEAPEDGGDVPEKEAEDEEKVEIAAEGDSPEAPVEQLAALTIENEQTPDLETPSLPTTQPEAGQDVTEDDVDWSHVPIKPRPVDEPHHNNDAGSTCSSSLASESDPTWVTPSNIHLHQARDMGVFPSLATPTTKSTATDAGDAALETPSILGAEVGTTTTTTENSDKGPTMKAALLTGDYAMQNVALQIGLNVLGVGGKRIRDVKTWILRCYACFKLCKDPTRKFCPSCGGTTLTRVSITYTPSSPTGYTLHLKTNFQYRNRGTVYSIPSSKPGSASFDKGGAKKTVNGATLVLREDQKEFQRGLKSQEIVKGKEERRMAKAAERGEKPSAFGGWNDPEWEPQMMLGEKGRKGGPRGIRGVQMGKDGLPVIGFGKNPNEVRRKR